MIVILIRTSNISQTTIEIQLMIKRVKIPSDSLIYPTARPDENVEIHMLNENDISSNINDFSTTQAEVKN